MSILFEKHKYWVGMTCVFFIWFIVIPHLLISNGDTFITLGLIVSSIYLVAVIQRFREIEVNRENSK